MIVDNMFDDFIIRGRRYGRYKVLTKDRKSIISEEVFCYDPFGAEGEIINYEERE
jgi:hypothetical protein